MMNIFASCLKKGVRGIHFCGEDDFSEVHSYCFSGFEIELLSVISEKSLLEDCIQNEKLALPELKSGELILLASLECQIPLIKLFAQQRLLKNKHWVLFN